MTEGTNARLTYTGTAPTTLDVVFSVCLDQTTGSDRDVQAVIYKNGSVVNGSHVITTVTSGQKHHLSCHADVAVVQNDYVEVYLKNDGASGDIRIFTFALSATTAGA
jgi:hypothetical protein